MFFSIGICQIKPENQLSNNLEKAKYYMDMVLKQGANIVLLPECWNCLYGIDNFEKYASEIFSSDYNLTLKSKTINFLHKYSSLNKGIYFIAGSIPELFFNDKGEKHIYNTCTIWYNGELINFYRKIHLFDIEIPNVVKFHESSVVSNGNKPVIIKTKWGNIGIGICYDLRFPELSKYYRDHNCIMICYPGAFTIPTGEQHWELLNRSHALNNQLYIASCSLARNLDEKYHSYGHSIVVNPSGKVIKQLDEKEDYFVEEIDLKMITNCRNYIPISKNVIKLV